MLDVDLYQKLFRSIFELEDPDCSKQDEAEKVNRIDIDTEKAEDKIYQITPQATLPPQREAPHRIFVTSPKHAKDCHELLDLLIAGNTVVIAKFDEIDKGLEKSLLNYILGGMYVLRGRSMMVADHIVAFMGENVKNV